MTFHEIQRLQGVIQQLEVEVDSGKITTGA